MSSPTSDYESTSSFGGGANSPQKQHSPNASDVPASAQTPSATGTLCKSSTIERHASSALGPTAHPHPLVATATTRTGIEATEESTVTNAPNAERERYEQLMKALEHLMQRVESDSESGTCTPNSPGLCRSFVAPFGFGEATPPVSLSQSFAPPPPNTAAFVASQIQDTQQQTQRQQQTQQQPKSDQPESSCSSSVASHRSRRSRAATVQVDGSTLPECMRSQPHARFFQAGVRALVLFDFAASGAGELSVRAGEIVELVAHETGSAWVCVRARAQSNACGYVPATYLAPVHCVVRPEPLLDLLEGAAAGATGAGVPGAAAMAIPEPPTRLTNERHSILSSESGRSHRTKSTNGSGSASHTSSSTSTEKLRHVSGSTANSGSRRSLTLSSAFSAIGNQTAGFEDSSTPLSLNSAQFAPVRTSTAPPPAALEVDVSRSAVCTPRLERRKSAAATALDTTQISPSASAKQEVPSSTSAFAPVPVVQSKKPPRPSVQQSKVEARAAKEKRRGVGGGEGGGRSLWEQLEARWRRQSSPSESDRDSHEVRESETREAIERRRPMEDRDRERTRRGSEPQPQIVHNMSRVQRPPAIAATNTKSNSNISRTATPLMSLASEMELSCRERSFTVSGATHTISAEKPKPSTVPYKNSSKENPNPNSNLRTPPPPAAPVVREEKLATRIAGPVLSLPSSGAPAAAAPRAQTELYRAPPLSLAPQSRTILAQQTAQVQQKQKATLQQRPQQQPQPPPPLVVETDLDTGLSATLVFRTAPEGGSAPPAASLGQNCTPLREAYV